MQFIKGSRTKNSIRNVAFVIVSKLLIIFLEFFVRTVFIKTLGATFLGINGLFSNILMVLNLAELGFSNAIIFCLYKPIAENNSTEVKKLMRFYGKYYSIIGMVIAILGLILIPFLREFIKYDGEIANIELIYLLYLIQTVLSYFFHI